ncbi:unnamed protein product, partial [Mesorhabditis spiculigera]
MDDDDGLALKTFRVSAIKTLTDYCPEYSLKPSLKKSSAAIPESRKTAWDRLRDDMFATLDPVVFLKAELDPAGKLLAVHEAVKGSEELGGTNTNMSLQRAPFHGAVTIKGSSNNVPFFPGGFDEELSRILEMSHDVTLQNDEERYLDFTELLNRPPGFQYDVELAVAQPQQPQADQIAVEQPEVVETPAAPPVELSTRDLFDFLGGSIGFELTEQATVKRADEAKKRKKPTDKLESPLAQPPDQPVEGTENLEVVLKRPLHEPSLLLAPKYAYAKRIDTQTDIPEYKDVFPRMAREYPFPLDPFQQAAICGMERGESVFVAAHTSAGILICRYRNPHFRQNGGGRALSNQKFRDFKMIFEEVGLVTGDIQLHPEAFCLIMTTEILRSMLYNGSEVIRELEWVVFDEVHYINDVERGHVWEEVLIMLPAHVKIVMLSATVPNADEFADWVGRIKNRRIEVVSTNKRPVPLEHHLYTGQDGKTRHDIFLVVDKTGSFQDAGYRKAKEAKEGIKKTANSIRGGKQQFQGGGGGHNRNDKNIYINLVDHLRSRDQLPVVCFVFSRKRCDDNAQMLLSMDLTTALEKNHIHRFFHQCVQRLKGSDKQLPQVRVLGELCQRGIGVHHSGILPILKEVVELLFQKGYVKVLMATETFAMGVNMPARTVVFDSIQKHDGKELRLLTPGEYVQMAGRAGRRGLDDTGNVIVLCKGQYLVDAQELKDVTMGRQSDLQSKFRVTYTMLLNLLRVEQLKIEDMLQRSYVESGSLRNALKVKEQLEMERDKLSEFTLPDCCHCFPEVGQTAALSQYVQEMTKYYQLRCQLWEHLWKEPGVSAALIAGRAVVVNTGRYGLGTRVAILIKMMADKLRVVIPCDKEELFVTKDVDTVGDEEAGVRALVLYGVDGCEKQIGNYDEISMRLLELGPSSLVGICKNLFKLDKTPINAADFDNEVQRASMPRFRKHRLNEPYERLMLNLVQYTNKFSPSEYQEIRGHIKLKDMMNQEMSFYFDSSREHVRSLRAQWNPLHCVALEKHLTSFLLRSRQQQVVEKIKQKLSPDSLALSNDYHDRLKMLKMLDYVDTHDMVTFKGRVACEIHHQELLITELILDGKLHSRAPEEVAALLSATTCQYKGSEQTLNHQMPIFVELMRDVLNTQDRIQANARVARLNLEEVGDELRFDLMEVVYLWARGESFAAIMEKTDCQEGLIVRCIQRLGEVCKDVRNAARIVGDPALFEKMEQVSSAIKRDIVFAASLYTAA